MKLLDYYYDYDYGHDFYAIIGQTRWFNLLDIIVHTSEFWSWSPDLRLTFSVFDGRVFSFEINFWSLSFYMDFMSYRSPMDLSHTRE
jgi:hypothetical protein